MVGIFLESVQLKRLQRVRRRRLSNISHSGFRLSLGSALTNLFDVAANSATGFDRPPSQLHLCHIESGVFSTPVVSCRGSCTRDTFGYAGLLWDRSVNPRIAATLELLRGN